MSESRCKSLKPGEVRKMPAGVRRRSTGIALALFGLGWAFYLGTLVGTVVAPWWPLKLIFSLANTFFIGILFVIGHDACHGAGAFAWLNAVLGRIAFMPSWHPYAGWEHAHNHVHHAWTNLRQKDYASAPLSKDDYDRLPAWRRAMVRFYRTPLGLGAYYFFDVYLGRTIFPSRKFRGRMHVPRFVGDCLLVAAFIMVQALFLVFAGRWFGSQSPALESLFFGQWLPFLLWNWLIAFLILLHHTHPRIPSFDDVEEWTFYRGQILGTARPFPRANRLGDPQHHGTHGPSCRSSRAAVSSGQGAGKPRAGVSGRHRRAQIQLAQLSVHAANVPALRLSGSLLDRLVGRTDQFAHDCGAGRRAGNGPLIWNAEFWRIQLPRGAEFVAGFARIQERATSACRKTEVVSRAVLG